jgi:2-methylcitrate dehydratase PrpD
VRTTDLAAYAADAAGSPLPADLDHWSRWALLDTLSVLIAGRVTPTSQAAARTASRTDGTTPLTGSVLTSNPVMAAFADATAANALDFEDGHYRGGGIHAGSTVLPTLLAVADPATPLSRLRSALVVGYEIAIRAGYLLSPAHGRPYRTSGHAASLGAAAAAAALLDGGPDVIASAIRIAASHAPVSAVHAGGACESIGWASATAVTSAFLALDGFTDERADASQAAPVTGTPFDDDAGTAFAESLGTSSEAVNCYVKPHACCRAIHAALDALGQLSGDLPDDPAAITSITVATQRGAVSLDNRRPCTLEQAQFSIPTMVALFVLEHQVGPTQAQPDHYRADTVRALADRVQVVHRSELDAPADQSYPAAVDILADGRHHRNTTWDALGSVTNPLTDLQRTSKARLCLTPALGTGGAQEVLDLILTTAIEPTIADLRHLTTRHTLPEGPH